MWYLATFTVTVGKTKEVFQKQTRFWGCSQESAAHFANVWLKPDVTKELAGKKKATASHSLEVDNNQSL